MKVELTGQRSEILFLNGAFKDVSGGIPLAIALLALLFLSEFFLAANLLLGVYPSLARSLLEVSFLSTHIIFGVIASLLALFSTVITMFYFIGTGKAVKESVQEWDLDKRYYEMVLKYKKRYFPTMTLALIVYISLPGVGAATSANYLSSGFHGLVAYLTVLTHGFICYQGWNYIFENDRLVATVDRLVREKQRENDSENREPDQRE